MNDVEEHVKKDMSAVKLTWRSFFKTKKDVLDKKSFDYMLKLDSYMTLEGLIKGNEGSYKMLLLLLNDNELLELIKRNEAAVVKGLGELVFKDSNKDSTTLMMEYLKQRDLRWDKNMAIMLERTKPITFVDATIQKLTGMPKMPERGTVAYTIVFAFAFTVVLEFVLKVA